jgi:hypothetical protein
MPAVNVTEAEALVLDGLGWDTYAEAERHLAEIKSPPTDPFYAVQYRLYSVEVKGKAVTPGEVQSEPSFR